MWIQLSGQSSAVAAWRKDHARFAGWFAFLAISILLQAVAIGVFGHRGLGARISSSFILINSVACVFVCFSAARRSGAAARFFWSAITLAAIIWVISQTYDIVAPPSFVNDLLYQFSTLPFGLALFLEPDHELSKMDPLHWADGVQTFLLWVTMYVYFTPHGMAPSVYGPSWYRSLFVDGMLLSLFLLRGVFTDSAKVRSLFLRMSVYCVINAFGDVYGSIPPVAQIGDWFDLVWALAVAAPILAAAGWNHNEHTKPLVEVSKARHTLFQQLFPLLYPAIIMAMLGGISHYYPIAAACIGIASFICFSSRLLVTQSRLRKGEAGLKKAKLAAEAANRCKERISRQYESRNSHPHECCHGND